MSNFLRARLIQCNYRVYRAKKDVQTIKFERDEEKLWMRSLADRRKRIERLEFELKALEDLPPEEINR